MQRFLRTGLLAILLALSQPSLYAQNIPGYGWGSLGVLPFGAVDSRYMKAPSQYVVYYSAYPQNVVGVSGAPVARAFSPDLKTWTVDTRDICATSGDLCTIGGGSAPLPGGTMTLPDGTLRVFFPHVGSNLVSATSNDGIVWTSDPGVRFTADPASIWERMSQQGGGFVLAIDSFVTLPDGSTRMYYTGGINPSSAGTPSYYAGNPFIESVILSARSTDNGLTWTRDPGVRINQLVQGPIASGNQFAGGYVTAVKVNENGQTVYRIYTSTLSDGAVSYVSSDGLNFVMEGQVPALGGDPQAMVLPDGRIWLENDQNAIVDTIGYGPQTLQFPSIQSVSSNVLTGFPAFVSGQMYVTGSSNSPVSFQVVNTATFCDQACPSHPEYYSISPVSGNASLGTTITYTGPTTDGQIALHATAGNVTAVAAIRCMHFLLNNFDTDVFCHSPMPTLPMNQLNFNFMPGANETLFRPHHRCANRES